MKETVFPDEGDLKTHREVDDKYFQLLFPILEKAQERGEIRKDAELLHLTAHFYGLYILVISAWYSGMVPDEEVPVAMELLFRQALEGLHPQT